MKCFTSMLLLAALPLCAEEPADDAEAAVPFEKYQTIIDRKPFGEPPDGFDPDKPPSAARAAVAKPSPEEAKQQAELEKQKQQLVQQLKVTMINVTPAGEVAVGFNAAEKHYYLRAGQEKDGWKVMGADLKANEATFEKDDIQLVVRIGGQATAESIREKTPAPAEAPAATAPAESGSSMSRLRERRKRRQEQAAEEARKVAEARAELARKEEEAKKRAEEDAKERERERERKEAQEKEMQEQRAKLQELADEIKRQREAKEAENPDGEENQSEEQP